jgi:hypothetical protein
VRAKESPELSKSAQAFANQIFEKVPKEALTDLPEDNKTLNPEAIKSLLSKAGLETFAKLLDSGKADLQTLLTMQNIKHNGMSVVAI